MAFRASSSLFEAFRGLFGQDSDPTLKDPLADVMIAMHQRIRAKDAGWNRADKAGARGSEELSDPEMHRKSMKMHRNVSDFRLR